MTNFIYESLLILIHIISIAHAQGSHGDVLGASACDIYGLNQHDCGIPDTPIESFPKECTSYLYRAIEVSENNTLTDIREKQYSIKGYLDKLLQTNVNVLVYYSHPNLKEWCAAIQCNDTARQTTEMNNLKSFLDKHPGIKGVILAKLYPEGDVSFGCPDYSQNLKSYIDLMHKTFPDLSIGIFIWGLHQKQNFQDPKLPWLDFKILDPSVDFYELTTYDINVCTDEFLKTGVYPLIGNYSNTVDNIRTFLEKTGVPKTKMHITFSIYGEGKNLDYCLSISTAYCNNVEKAKSSICVDTIKTLTEKGAYAKKNSAGFIANNIDMDDTLGTCQCGEPFPGFRALLNGYNGAPPPPPCALFDRT